MSSDDVRFHIEKARTEGYQLGYKAGKRYANSEVEKQARAEVLEELAGGIEKIRIDYAHEVHEAMPVPAICDGCIRDSAGEK